MLYFLLIMTGCLLAATNSIACRFKRPGAWIVGLCLVVAVGQVFLGFLVPLVSLLALLLIASLVVWDRSSRGPAFFRSLSIGSAAVVLTIASGIALWSERGYGRLRILYPYESLEGRLPLLPVSAVKPPLGADADARLSRLDRFDFPSHLRRMRLKGLHEEKVRLFIDSFGFGYSRMMPGPSERNLLVHREVVPGQPGSRASSSSSPGDWEPAEAGEALRLGRLLDRDLIDFANPSVFGYINDRMHVAGFRPHQFSQDPGSGEDWKVRTLDLVGLLLAREPRVYVSEKLPSMAEVGEVPTRPLDKSEALGLAALRDGEDLWFAKDGDEARMLGAIRSNVQCIACHGGHRGELLGAFSYTLTRADAADRGPARLE